MSMSTLPVQDQGLTLGEVLSSIPHDPAAIVAYLLVAAFAAFIWIGNRNARGGGAVGPRGASTDVPRRTERRRDKS